MKRYIKASIESELKKYENSGEFGDWQLEQIRKGLENGVDVSWYADPKYGWMDMATIRLDLEEGIDVSWYADPKYDHGQRQEISWGLNKGVDVSVYADPKYDEEQMRQIRYGLEQGLDVSVYADPKYDWYQMSAIRKGLEQGVDVSKYADPKYDSKQMNEIREKLEGKTPQKPKRVNWKSIARQLKKEAEDGIDPLYKLTDAGEYVNGICLEVETALGVELEPSVQAGRGGIWFYSTETNQTVASNYDYQTFNEEIVDLAINSKNKKEFKVAYEIYLEDILTDPEYAPEYDD